MNTMIAIGIIIMILWAWIAQAKAKAENAKQREINRMIRKQNNWHKAKFERACNGMVSPQDWMSFTHKERAMIRAERKWRRKN